MNEKVEAAIKKGMDCGEYDKDTVVRTDHILVTIGESQMYAIPWSFCSTLMVRVMRPNTIYLYS